MFNKMRKNTLMIVLLSNVGKCIRINCLLDN